MSVYIYRKFKVSIDEESKKTQGLRSGDIVRRQYYDGSVATYSLMCVLQTGKDTVSVVENGVNVEKERKWFIGALLEGDAPQSSELLDFVRVTNLWDANRLGAIYMTANDSESPYIDIIDGIPVEQSLCYPTSINNVSWSDSFSQYCVSGKEFVTSEYIRQDGANFRICKITRNNTIDNSTSFIGISQLITKGLSNPDRLLISYKIRSNRALNNVIGTLGYEDGTRVDGTVNTNTTTSWEYKLHVITVDFSDRYKRVFKLNVNDGLVAGDIVEIADLNIVLLSSVANFAGGLKLRLGKLNGITDPVFGSLENYGAYIQRLYATQQVNISGTLTAGDENGFGSNFYAGKIHKNAIINSIACDFASSVQIVQEHNPVGIGEIYKSSTELILNAQTNSWCKNHIGKRYCFSFWAKSNINCSIVISQNKYRIGTIQINNMEWKRYSVTFCVQEITDTTTPLQFGLLSSNGELKFTAPQLEFGNCVTQYQPTDDILTYSDDYGAWFNKGGIGGTIQNPLLKLNEDGSISSKNNSFVINNDGTGYFANGRFKWTHDSILLQGITIKWEDLDDTAKEELKSKSINIIGPTSFILDENICTPSKITLELSETNITSSNTNRTWYYMLPDGTYTKFLNENGRSIVILPDLPYWNNQQTLTIKCVVNVNFTEYTDTITIQKVKHGDDNYSVSLFATNGNTFKNGVGETTIVAHVFKGKEDITSQIPPTNFDWIKTSNNPDTDAIFNASHVGYGNKLTVTSEDIWNMAQFDCKVRINT